MERSKKARAPRMWMTVGQMERMLSGLGNKMDVDVDLVIRHDLRNQFDAFLYFVRAPSDIPQNPLYIFPRISPLLFEAVLYAMVSELLRRQAKQTEEAITK